MITSYKVKDFDELFYREGRVDGVSWEEINNSFLGLFGYTNKLNPLITKKEILTL